MRQYDVIFHIGETIGLKDVALSGIARIEEGYLVIEGEPRLTVALADVASVDLVRPGGVGTMVKITTSSQTVFVAVPRININGKFVMINLLKTRKLRNWISEAAGQA